MEGFQSSSEDNEAILDIVTKANVGANKTQNFNGNHGFEQRNRDFGKYMKEGSKTKNKLNLIRRGGTADSKKHSKKFQLMDKKLRMRLRKKFEEENQMQ